MKCSSCKTECVIEGLVKNAEMAAKENINSGYPLVASSARLHKQLLTFLSESPSMPLDIFEKGEVVREEHYCVPGYLFYCNGTASYTYEAGNVRQQTVVRDNGEKSWEETRRHTEWTQMSGTANASAVVFASGSRTVASQIIELYMFLDPKKLVDYEELEFPHDVVTYDNNLPQAAAFNEHVKPYMERILKKQAKKSLEGRETRNLSMGGGSRIDKDEIIRVFLGLYRVVFKYGGKEYAIWVTGKGEKVISSEERPVDTERQKVLEEKQKAKEAAIANIPAPQTGLLNLGKWACIIVGLFFLPIMGCGGCVTSYSNGYGNSGFGMFYSMVAIPFISGAIAFGIIRSKKRKEFAIKKTEVGAPFQKEIDNFISQPKAVLDQFRNQKKGLRGIYEAEVTGDASAF